MTSRITTRDLLAYVSFKPLDAEVRAEINRQAKITGSAVQKWLADFDAKRRAPLDVDWAAVAAVPDDDNNDEGHHGQNDYGRTDSETAQAAALEAVARLVDFPVEWPANATPVTAGIALLAAMGRREEFELVGGGWRDASGAAPQDLASVLQAFEIRHRATVREGPRLWTIKSFDPELQIEAADIEGHSVAQLTVEIRQGTTVLLRRTSTTGGVALAAAEFAGWSSGEVLILVDVRN